MDIFTHTLTGMAAAGAISSIGPRSCWRKVLMMCCGGIGAVLPDLDTITRWHRFDEVIGTILDLSTKGKEMYYDNHWYSHHNASHSLAAGAASALVFALLLYLARRFSFWKTAGINQAQSIKWYSLAFFAGYIMHLLGDLPTPGYVWEGIRLWWPLSTPVGGTGHLWWFNNYDIFLLFLTANMIMVIMILLAHIFKKPVLTYLPATIFALAILASFYQITQRPINFKYGGQTVSYAEKEKQSLAIQKSILGNRLYRVMRAFDRRVKIPF